MKDINRFWPKVQIGSADECWPWIGYKNESGYGIFWLEGKGSYAHRFSLSIDTPMPEKGLYCLHSCDNPTCVNPNHLRWGNCKDNSDDKVSRERHLKGSYHPRSVLNEAIVDTLLKMRMSGKTLPEISEALGINEKSIIGIYVGRRWTHRHGVNGNPTFEELTAMRAKRKPRKRPRQS